MCRLTSADKGRTDAAASFRHGRKKQTGVALAAKLPPGAAAAAATILRVVPDDPPLAVDFSPTNKQHKQATLFLTSRLSPLIMLRTFSLSPSISSAALRS